MEQNNILINEEENIVKNRIEGDVTPERMDELFNTNGSNLAICVGSWRAYNNAREHSLGACWKGHYYIDFEKLEGSEELYRVLKTLGWSDLEMEELFIQDYEGLALFAGQSCDFIDPAQVADLLHDNHVDLDEDGEKLEAMMQYLSFSLHECIEKLDDYGYYKGSAEDYEREQIEECYPELDFDKFGWIGRYISIDYEAIARDDYHIIECENGVLYEL